MGEGLNTMRAVIIATGSTSSLSSLVPSSVSPMLPVGDRPILQHVLEKLVTAGFRQIDMVLGEAAHQVEHHFGEGQRWGCSIRYHLTADFERAAALLVSLGRKGEPFLLAQGDVLPRFAWNELQGERAVIPFDISLETGYAIDEHDWTGWAWLPGAIAAAMPAQATWSVLWTWLAELVLGGKAITLPAEPGLSTRDAGAYLLSQQRALTVMGEELQFSAFPAGPGIWIGRNVSLPSTVELIAPVLVGEHSQIGKFASLGPGAVISPGCLVDEYSRVGNAVVLAGSYVGRHLNVDHSVVSHDQLLNVRLGTVLAAPDAFLLSRMEAAKSAKGTGGLIGRCLAVIFTMLAAPLMLLITIWRLLSGQFPPKYQHPFVRTPAKEDGPWTTCYVPSLVRPDRARKADGWSHFWQVFLPGLLSVARGDLALVGVAPRTADELRALPHDWREMCLQARPGLLTEAFVQTGPEASDDERYPSEAFCAVAGDWQMAWRVVGRYMGLLAMGRPHPQEPVRWRKAE
jgi:hypothetical protein